MIKNIQHNISFKKFKTIRKNSKFRNLNNATRFNINLSNSNSLLSIKSKDLYYSNIYNIRDLSEIFNECSEPVSFLNYKGDYLCKKFLNISILNLFGGK